MATLDKGDECDDNEWRKVAVVAFPPCRVAQDFVLQGAVCRFRRADVADVERPARRLTEKRIHHAPDPGCRGHGWPCSLLIRVQKKEAKKAENFWMFRLFSKTGGVLVVDEGKIQKGGKPRVSAVFADTPVLPLYSLLSAFREY